MSVWESWKFVGLMLFDSILCVQVLHLNSCNLLKIPSLQNLSGLSTLSLNSNKFRVLHSNAFSGANNLTKILLSSNGIEMIENEAFSNLLLLKVKSDFISDCLLFSRLIVIIYTIDRVASFG